MKASDRRYYAVWKLDRVISRFLAAWCAFVVWVLARAGERPAFGALSFAQNYSFLLLGLFVAGGFVLFSWIALVAYPYHSDSWLLLLGATACVWYWSVGVTPDQNKPLNWLAVSAIYALFAVWVFSANRKLFAKHKLGTRTVWIIGLCAAAASCVVIAAITCLRYKTFSSPNYDFGLFVNMFHNMRETGLPMVTSERDRLLSHFAVHISPVYYLLLPFYWLFPSPLTLQIGQAVVLMLGVIPILLLCKHYKLSGWATAVISLLYAFYPALSTGCFYDIHENCFLTLFLLLTFYFYESKHPILLFFSALLVLSVKEDAAVYLLIFALYLILSRRSYRTGLLLALLSGGYFMLSGYLLKTYGLGMMVNRFDNLIYDPEMGLLGVVKTALVNPGFVLTQLFTTSKGGWEKILYFCQLFLPLGMLPLCSKKPSRWLLAAPVLMNLITYYQYQYDLGFQYHFGITAFLFYAAIQNLPTLSEHLRRTLLGVSVAFCLCLWGMLVAPTLTSYATRYEDGKENYARMEEILDTVPADASVNCSTFLLAHLADRDEIYEIGYHDNKSDVDYVVIDLRYGGWQSTANAYLAHGYTTTFREAGKILILQRPEA